MSGLSEAAEKLVSVSHIDQVAGLEAVLAAKAHLTASDVERLMPNVVRHVERSGYPAVVGLAVQVLRECQSQPTFADAFAKWSGIQRLISAIGHKNDDVRVACLVFLAQLGGDARWSDTIAVNKGYRVLVELMEAGAEREQLASHVALRVLLQLADSNVSDFARAGGFQALFRLVRGQTKVSAKVLAQTMLLLKLGGANRTVAVEIKSSVFEMDVAKHLGNSDEKVGVLWCMERCVEPRRFAAPGSDPRRHRGNFKRRRRTKVLQT